MLHNMYNIYDTVRLRKALSLNGDLCLMDWNIVAVATWLFSRTIAHHHQALGSVVFRYFHGHESMRARLSLPGFEIACLRSRESRSGLAASSIFTFMRYTCNINMRLR